VLRQRIWEGPRPGADPLREVACHRTAAAAGVTPAVLDAVPDGSWILMNYVEGGMWTPAAKRRKIGWLVEISHVLRKRDGPCGS
jgi:hypothetical protein